MKPTAATWSKAAAIIVILAGGYVVGSKRFTGARHALQEEVNSSARSLTTINGQLKKAATIEESVRSFQDRTLGGTLETADSALRARLNRIGEEVQLRNVTVSTGPMSAQRSPARSRYRQRELRDEDDFIELRGSIIGEGSMEQALRLLHRVQAEPWLKHVMEFRIDPRANGSRVNVTLRLATIYLRDREPGARDWPAYDPGGFAPYAALAAANPFRVPPPERAPAPEVAVAAAAAPAGVAYGQWVLTIVALDQGGAEVWLLHRTSGESRRLVIGDRLAEAQFVAVEGDQARFQLGPDQFVIQVGQSLDDRSPIPR